MTKCNELPRGKTHEVSGIAPALRVTGKFVAGPRPSTTGCAALSDQKGRGIEN